MSQETVKRTVLRSDDFTCPSCVGKIEQQLARIDGVDRAEVHFNTGRIGVEHDPDRVSAEDLIRAVAEAGYRVRQRAF